VPSLHRHELRASDEEREKVATMLRQACSEGRLDTEELEQRVEVAYGARTRGELDAIVRDLPGARQAHRAGRHRRAWRTALASYVTFNAWMVGIWAATGAHYFWPIWTLLPAGIALLGARLRGEGPPPGRLRPGRHDRRRDRSRRRDLPRPQ